MAGGVVSILMKLLFILIVFKKTNEVINRENTIFENGQTSADFENIPETFMNETNLLPFLQVRNNDGLKLPPKNLNLTEFNSFVFARFF